MDARELRVGNILLFQESKGELFGINKDCIVQYSQDNDVFNCGIDEIKPIELTEEILLKCGFEFKPKGEEVYEQFWICNDFEIWQHSEGFCHDFLNGGDVNYLHQLQNLYWCLTNEELTINL